MGYSTHFYLKIHEGEVTIEEVMNENKDLEELNWVLEENGESDEPRKWHAHVEDVAELSTRYPSTVFSLKGDGEAQGDSWYRYFKNGKVQVCRAKIEYDSYDESKLESLNHEGED